MTYQKPTRKNFLLALLTIVLLWALGVLLATNTINALLGFPLTIILILTVIHVNERVFGEQY